MLESSKELVNEVVISPVETENEINIFKQPNNPTPEHMEALIEKLQSTAWKPPQVVHVTTESPSGSDKDDSNASLIPTSNVEPAQVNQDDQSPIVEPGQVNQDDQNSTFDEDFLANEETFASGSSSAPPPPEHDSASVKLAKLLAFQDTIPQSRGNGISIGSGQGGDEDSQQTIFELKQEIVIFKQEKDLLIGNLDVRVSELAKENSQKSSNDGKASDTSERSCLVLPKILTLINFCLLAPSQLKKEGRSREELIS
ncbi:unnamed protein product [Lactuca virosa]|uniref:Uncharacterized protein n=1 Tax=Lactuca virosa TaxID=75947 RepID=A0AAU9PKR2_9ASTR|nr:unnamed protein product [Lactuca virosa]